MDASHVIDDFAVGRSSPSINVTNNVFEVDLMDNETMISDCLRPFFIPDSQMFVSIYGFASPVLIAITIVTNCFVCAVLLRKNMRSPTNALLVAIAAADLLTGALPLPCFLHFYTSGACQEWAPCSWVKAYRILTDVLPTTFHTASIWLIVMLAVQRYIYVCHAHRARELCTVKNAVICIVIVYVLAIIFQITRFMDMAYIPFLAPSKALYGSSPCSASSFPQSFSPNLTSEFYSLLETSTATHRSSLESLRTTASEIETFNESLPLLVQACHVPLNPFVQKYADEYFNFYYWNRVILIHLVPCTSLVVLNVLLVMAMSRAKRRRAQLLKQNRRSESRRLADSNCTTLMLIAVVGLFLLVEFPLALLLIVMIADNTFNLELIDPQGGAISSLTINFFILLSYPLNFFIYCGMSRQFRQTFTQLFCPSWLSTRLGVSSGRSTGAEKTGVTEMSDMNGAGGTRTLYETLAPCREMESLVRECETAQ